MKGFVPPQDTQEEIFCRKVRDAAMRCEKISRPIFIGFLDERQQLLAQAQLAGAKWSQHLFFGGCVAAERKVLCVYIDTPPCEDEFPFTAVWIHCKAENQQLSHRDYLGALLALGLERRCIGDIFVQHEGAIAFVLDTQIQLVQNELLSVGRYNAAVERCAELPTDLQQSTKQEITATVASLRLDAVLAAALRQSRPNVSALISAGKAQVSHLTVTSTSFLVAQGDSLTVRGEGKFRLTSVGGQSKKGRIFITIIKY